MNKKRFAYGMLIFLLAALLSGCGGGSAAAVKEKDEITDDAEHPVRIGMIFDTFVVERWIRDRDVFIATAKEEGATVDITNANGSIEAQQQAIRYYTEQGYDAIVIVAIDSSPLVRPVKEAHDKGIPVISYDRLIQRAQTDLYVSFDNREVGRLMAESATGALPSAEGNIALILGPKSDNNILLIEEGIREVLKDAHGINLIDITYIDDWDASLAYSYTEEHTDLMAQADVIICGNDNFAGSVTRALTANRIPLPVIIGQDADLDACQRIVEGTQKMTVFKPVHLLAQEAARAAVSLAKGEAAATLESVDDGAGDVAAMLLTPQAVTADNMESVIVESGFHTRDEVWLNVH